MPTHYSTQRGPTSAVRPARAKRGYVAGRHRLGDRRRPYPTTSPRYCRADFYALPAARTRIERPGPATARYVVAIERAAAACGHSASTSNAAGRHFTVTTLARAI